MKSIQLSRTLNKIFNNKQFIESIINSGKFERECLATVLKYYITTRDTNTSYSYQEIEEMYKKIEKQYLSAEVKQDIFESKKTAKNLTLSECEKIQHSEIIEQYMTNIISDGVLTHAFNGNKMSLIEKYGLDYVNKKMTNREKKEIKDRRESLHQLENILGKSRFIQAGIEKANGNEYNDEIFLSTPGGTTIHYALQHSPERLYEGPLKNLVGFGEIVGEEKDSYIFRCIEEEIYRRYGDSREYKQYIQIARDVAKYYCSQNPGIALIDINKIKDIKVGRTNFNNTSPEVILKNCVFDWTRKISDFFTRGCFGDMEGAKTDLATRASFIPKDAISIVNIMDEYQLNQIRYMAKVKKIGNTFDDKEPTVNQYIGAILYKNDDIEFNVIRKKYGELNRSELEKINEDLLSKEKEILDRSFKKKDGINTNDNYSLKAVLEGMQENNTMTELLEKDLEIKKDNLQYWSRTHGELHTRRVNFFATTIMDLEGVKGRDREIIWQIVKNHDIGRQHDYEDKEHGEKSVQLLNKNQDRLIEFNEEEQQLIKFIIKEHSMSSKENEQDINELPFAIRKKYEKVLNIFKDADKLDRVRLDPDRMNSRGGLNIERLSLESSKKLECLAYESYDKLIEILDIKREQLEIDKFMELSKQIEHKSQSKNFIDEIRSESKLKVGIKGINKIVHRVREFIESKGKKREEDRENQINMENDKIQVSPEQHIEEDFIGNTGHMYLVHDKTNNSEYYFKPAVSKNGAERPYRAHIQEAAYLIQKIVNPENAVKCNVSEIMGMFGAIQERIPIDANRTKEFKEFFDNGNGEISPEIISQLVDEYLVDFCLCNYDSHSRNFIIDNNGKLRGIDKEQSFRYIKEDTSKDMQFSTNYNERYGENPTVYNLLFEKMKQGEISYKYLERLRYRASRLAQYPDDQYRNIFQQYAYGKAKTPQEAESLLDNIVDRKKNILQEIENLYNQIYNEQFKNRNNQANQNTENEQNPLHKQFSEQEIGKATIATTTIKKGEAQERVTKDEKELNLEQGEIKE